MNVLVKEISDLIGILPEHYVGVAFREGKKIVHRKSMTCSPTAQDTTYNYVFDGWEETGLCVDNIVRYFVRESSIHIENGVVVLDNFDENVLFKRISIDDDTYSDLKDFPRNTCSSFSPLYCFLKKRLENVGLTG